VETTTEPPAGHGRPWLDPLRWWGAIALGYAAWLVVALLGGAGGFAADLGFAAASSAATARLMRPRAPARSAA
jgi:hypothetical protein